MLTSWVGTASTVRKWVRQAEIDSGDRAAQSAEESEVLRALRRENAELKRANAILKAASAFLAAELARPTQQAAAPRYCADLLRRPFIPADAINFD